MAILALSNLLRLQQRDSYTPPQKNSVDKIKSHRSLLQDKRREKSSPNNTTEMERVASGKPICRKNPNIIIRVCHRTRKSSLVFEVLNLCGS